VIARAMEVPPCKVFDANGLEWKYMRWVNTETGEGEQVVVNAQGERQLNETRNAVLTQMVKMAAPVTLVPIEMPECAT
jgi:hypothetical protein